MTQLPPQGPGHHDLENLIFLGQTDRQTYRRPRSDPIGAGGQISVYRRRETTERETYGREREVLMGIVHRANSHAPVSIAAKPRLTLISMQLPVEFVFKGSNPFESFYS